MKRETILAIQKFMEQLKYAQNLSEAEKLFDEVELQNQETIH